jgi:hypothetical protein
MICDKYLCGWDFLIEKLNFFIMKIICKFLTGFSKKLIFWSVNYMGYISNSLKSEIYRNFLKFAQIFFNSLNLYKD